MKFKKGILGLFFLGSLFLAFGSLFENGNLTPISNQNIGVKQAVDPVATTSVYVAGKQVVDRNNITYWDYQFGNMGSCHSTDYYTAKYDPSTFTLTLKNFMFSGAGYPFSPFGDEWHKNYYGIYANGDLNIVVEETNNITLAFAYAHEAMDSYAIASYGSLVIKGNGTLNAEVASPSAGGTAGIYAEKSLTFSGNVNVTASSNESYITAGIFCSEGRTTIGTAGSGDNPKIVAKGGYGRGSSGPNVSIGISSNNAGTVTANSGTLIAKGGTAITDLTQVANAGLSYGISNNKIVFDSSLMALAGATESSINNVITSGSTTDYRYVVVEPVASYNITINSNGNGTASANKTSAKVGETISLTNTPNSCYAFEKWEVSDGNVIIADNQFIMPPSDVVIKAIFKESHVFNSPTYEWNGDQCTAKRVCATDANHVESETVTATKILTKQKTCYLDELYSYVTSFRNAAFETQRKDEIKTADKLGHTYGTWIDEVGATCEHTGIKGHYHCDVCGDNFDASHQIITDLTIATIGHTYGSWIAEVPATCKDLGVKGHYHCNVCNKNFDVSHQIITDIIIPALGHTYGEWIEEVPSTVESVGTKGHYHCNVCGKNFDSDHVEISDISTPAITLVFEEILYAWNEDGNRCTATRVCLTDPAYNQVETVTAKKIVTQVADCNQEEQSTYVAVFSNPYFITQIRENVVTGTKLEHSYGTWIDEVSATCGILKTKGHYHCDEFGRNFDIEHNEITDLTIAALEHNYGEWIDEVPATDTSAGTKGHYHCDQCGKNFDSNHVEMTDLTISPITLVYQDPTYVWSEAGGKCTATRVCTTDATYTQTETVTAKKVVTQTGNCQQEEKSTYVAIFANPFFVTQTKDNVVTAAISDHTYGTWIEEIPATATTAGVKGHYHCNECGKNFDADYHEITDLSIPVITLNYETPTYVWNEAGDKCTATRVCTTDAAYTQTETVIAKKVVTQTGNCEQEEKSTFIAVFTNPNFVTQIKENVVTASKSAHIYGEWIEEVSATTESTGTKGHYHCSVCGKNYDADHNEITDLVIPRLTETKAKNDNTIAIAATSSLASVLVVGLAFALGKFFQMKKNK